MEARPLMKAVILLSDDLDSMACVHFYKAMRYDLQAVFYDYGQLSATQARHHSELIAQRSNIP